MSTSVVGTVATPDGPFMILENDEGHVISSGWTDSVDRLIGRLVPTAQPEHVAHGRVQAAEAVDAFYDGDLDGVLRTPVTQFGTDLLKTGWDELRTIPAGSVISYTELAARIERPQAVRVAGSVCARNAPALFVPCHRVRRSDGTLGGFAWGLSVKASLLAREGALPTSRLW